MAEEQKKEQIQRLMVAKCSRGSMDFQYLNLDKDHGVYFQDTDHPLMNASDHVGETHVLQFGRCGSPTNPKNMASGFAGFFNPIAMLVKQAKKAMGCEGCKCSPKTLKVWENTNEGNCLDGADGLLNISKLQCFYGGEIVITKEPESEKSKGGEEEENKQEPKKNAVQRMPDAMAEKVNSLNSSPASEPSGDSSGSAGASEASGGSGAGTGTSGGGNGAGTGMSGGGSGAETGMSGGGGTEMPGTDGGGGTEMSGVPETNGGSGTGAGMSGLCQPGTVAAGGFPGTAAAVAAGLSKGLNQELIMDMISWYASNESGFEQLYGVSDAISRLNYANNMRQALPLSCLNAEGLICDLTGLSAFRMGGGSAASIGQACAGCYNILRQLGEKPSMAGIILAAERQQTVAGIMDQGPMAVSMASTRDYLNTLGFETRILTPEQFLGRTGTDASGSAALLGASAGGAAAFHTLRTAPGGRLCCPERNELQVSKLLTNETKQPMLVMEVGRGKNAGGAAVLKQSGRKVPSWA